MIKKYFPPSELIINEDGSVFHLHVKPEQLASKVILVGDPGRVALVASHFESRECEIENREFKTITGTYKGKRVTVLSTGIGCDNIDIVVNELDALANIDFRTREEKDDFRQLEMVRIGTCGGLQPYTPEGSFICSEISVGFDGLLNFYEGRNAVCDLPIERALLNHLGWSGNLCAPAPYVIHADEEMVERIARHDMTKGITVSCGGFSGHRADSCAFHSPTLVKMKDRVVCLRRKTYNKLRDGKLGTGRTFAVDGTQSHHCMYSDSQPRSERSEYRL